jgi:hypothetical protein
MKNRMVGSWQIENSSMPLQFVLFADAYLDSAARLCKAFKRSTRKLSYPRGAVVLSLAFHALELFLKAAILQKNPKEKLHHDVERLESIYRLLYPGDQFQLDVPFKTEFLGFQPEEIAKKRLAFPQDQLNRYPCDKSGRNWGGVFAFEPISFLPVIEQLQRDFERLQRLIFTTDGVPRIAKRSR